MNAEDHSPFITVYESIGGWKAVQMWWNPKIDGFWEPWTTGVGAYDSREDAEAEAKAWAEADDIRLVLL
jgi:hypothetical protein